MSEASTMATTQPGDRAPLSAFSLRRRMARVEFIAHTVSAALVAIVLLSALASFIALFLPGLAPTLFPLAFSLVLYVVVPLTIMLFAVRRLHDTGKPGWLVLLLLVPVVNILIMTLLAAWPGSAEANAFGAARPAPSTAALTAAVALPLLLLAAFFASEPFEAPEAAPVGAPIAAPAAAPSETLRSYRP
jgi:uncharacterized membrane protein YhaH (DUF805 family)